MSAIKLEFDDNTELRDVLEKLIFYKEVVGEMAYTDFKGIRYFNSDVEELKKLKKLTNPIDKDTENIDNNLLSTFYTKMNCNKDLVYWINKAKEYVEETNKDEFEYTCYNYATSDNNNFSTIKSAAYLLCVFQSNPLAFEADYINKKTLDKIMLEVDSYFNFEVFYNILIKYCSYSDNMKKLLTEYIPTPNYEEEYNKMKRLRIKLENE